jgi:hypothetical protein
MGMYLVSLKTGKILRENDDQGHDDDPGPWVRGVDAEPYFTQCVGSDAAPAGRTSDGRFDTSHLSPEKAYRLGRDYLAHCIRYGYPMKVIRDKIGLGARILEFGCGRELPLFKALTHDHSASTYYKPRRYVGVDLNPIGYWPQVSGIEVTLMPNTNIITQPELLPDEVFDVVVSFEVIEHMDKSDGILFAERLIAAAKRTAEGEKSHGLLVVSTPVNNGIIAKNHIYEWHRGEMRRLFEDRGCAVLQESGTFANIRDILDVLTPEEAVVWNRLAEYHSPHVLSAVFSASHPEAARNICWLMSVPR